MSPEAAHQRLAARRARTRRIRRTGVAFAVALFIATWAVIYSALVAGHDPALANSTAKPTTAKSSSSAPSVSVPSTASQTPATSAQAPSTDSAPPVSTSQS